MPKKIGLKTRPKEPLSSTVERIENVKFNYTPLNIPKIVYTLSIIQPAHFCRDVGYTRIANKITETGCREEGNLLDLFAALYHLY